MDGGATQALCNRAFFFNIPLERVFHFVTAVQYHHMYYQVSCQHKKSLLQIAEQLAPGLPEGASGGHEARILLRTLDIPGHVDFYVLK
jgi:hypothetical protein